jgi:hypothetical protein
MLLLHSPTMMGGGVEVDQMLTDIIFILVCFLIPGQAFRAYYCILKQPPFLWNKGKKGKSVARHTFTKIPSLDMKPEQKIIRRSSDINLKLPQSTGFFAPRQDATYAGLTPACKCLTAWVKISDYIGEQEGCLSFYPKSHMMGQLPHGTTKTSDDSLLSLGQYIAPKPPDACIPFIVFISGVRINPQLCLVPALP